MSQQFTRIKRHKTLTAVGAVVALLAVGGLTGCKADDTKTGSGTKNGAASTSRPAKGKGQDAGKGAPKEKTIGGNGTYEVGKDIQPGTYVTAGNTDDQCYWERQKDAKGETDSILANDNVTGSSYVTVLKTDKYFKTSDCADWVAAPTTDTPKTEMKGSGMYKVGVDIAPGTYKSTGNKDDACYWERAKDALHGLDSIAANDNVSGTAVVTITSKDAYFKTKGCGDWKKA